MIPETLPPPVAGVTVGAAILAVPFLFALPPFQFDLGFFGLLQLLWINLLGVFLLARG